MSSRIRIRMTDRYPLPVPCGIRYGIRNDIRYHCNSQVWEMFCALRTHCFKF
jgi:hypothetical protein